MKARIINIKGCKTTKSVLLQIERLDTGEDIVSISAWHEHDDGDFYQYERVEFPEASNPIPKMERFIVDYSEVSADVFANSINF